MDREKMTREMAASKSAERCMLSKKKLGSKDVVLVKYHDHVLYHRCNAATMKPQIRECVGWLIREAPDYVVLCWDRDAEPPTLKGGDPKASGLVLLRSVIQELKHLV